MKYLFSTKNLYISDSSSGDSQSKKTAEINAARFQEYAGWWGIFNELVCLKVFDKTGLTSFESLMAADFYSVLKFYTIHKLKQQINL